MHLKKLFLTLNVCNAMSLPFEHPKAELNGGETTTSHTPAPILSDPTEPENVIHGDYIIEFNPNVDAQTMYAHLSHLNAKLIHIGDFRGYAGSFSDAEVGIIRQSGIVKYVEPDSRVYTEGSTTQNNCPWGLARISHHEHLTIRNYAEYLYDGEGGEGVTAYVIDTGVNTDHVDFEGRASWGMSVSKASTSDSDTRGHGTHVAGIIGSKSFGVAKKAKIVAVKVLSGDGSGSISNVIKGIEWVVNQHKNSKDKGSTANLSLGGGKSQALESALNAAVSSGVHFAVAAGNANVDACSVSPGGASGPITVGAADLSDKKASFSNWGKCVDIWGPGVSIISLTNENNRGTKSMSGTSMASPHVCGLLTYFLSLQPKITSQYGTAASNITPAQLKKHLLAFGTKNMLSGLDSASPNLIPFNGAGDSLDGFHKAVSMLTELEF